MIKSNEFMILQYHICSCVDNAYYIISLWTRTHIFLDSGTAVYKISMDKTTGQTGHIAVGRHDLHLAKA